MNWKLDFTITYLICANKTDCSHEFIYKIWMWNIYVCIFQVVWKIVFFNVSLKIFIAWCFINRICIFLCLWNVGRNFFRVQNVRSWPDKPRSITPDLLTRWEEFARIWSISVEQYVCTNNNDVLSLVLVGDVIMF